MAADKPSKPVEEKNFFMKLLESNAYSGAAAAKRKKQIDEATDEPASSVPATDKQSSSYKQYMHEKSVGGPSTDNYEAWKKLG